MAETRLHRGPRLNLSMLVASHGKKFAYPVLPKSSTFPTFDAADLDGKSFTWHVPLMLHVVDREMQHLCDHLPFVNGRCHGFSKCNILGKVAGRGREGNPPSLTGEGGGTLPKTRTKAVARCKRKAPPRCPSRSGVTPIHPRKAEHLWLSTFSQRPGDCASLPCSNCASTTARGLARIHSPHLSQR